MAALGRAILPLAWSRSTVSFNTPTRVVTRYFTRSPGPLSKDPLANDDLSKKLGEQDQELNSYLQELRSVFNVDPGEHNEESSVKKPNIIEGPSKIDKNKGFPLASQTSYLSKIQVTLLRRIHFSACLKTSDRGDNCDAPLKPSLREQHERFHEDSAIIWDHDEIQSGYYLDYYPEQEKTNPLQSAIFERGETGVFDIVELVELLREERLQDIAVIEIPEELAYADYLVVATVISARQSRAVASFLKKMYKRKKNSDDQPVKIEGLESDEWKVLDMGNIVLHLFDHPTREKYSIESLWALGPEFDDNVRNMEQEAQSDPLQEQIDFVRSLSPQTKLPQQLANNT